jgi:cadmium resistance protein CadD (predicted permease)
VLSGYLAAIAVILACGLLLGRLAAEIPAGALGYLGLLPLGIGLNRLRIALFARQGRDAGIPQAPAAMTAGGTAMLNIANGSDTLSVFTALLADNAAPFDYVITTTIIASAILWFLLALFIGRHPLTRRSVPTVETWLVPVLLVCVGLYILADTATDTVVG